MAFLPVTKEDMKGRGWECPDFVLVTGDAYVDHPSFGAAIIGRVLEAEGFRVAVLAQPNWKSKNDFERFGRPKLGFMVTGGNIDSMVAHYTAAKRKRSADAYSPGGKIGKRPDRAVIAYSRQIRAAFGDIPIIIGGLEASLRRFAHYDYWDDAVRPSVLADSRADLLIYGMGETQTIEIAHRLADGEPVTAITQIRGTAYLTQNRAAVSFPAVDVAGFENTAKDKKIYAKTFKTIYENQDSVTGKALCQPHPDGILVQNPPMPPIPQEEFDRVYALPYMRDYHHCYAAQGGVPAIEEVSFSIIHNRGCFGGCHFCSLAFHQGRLVTSRSKESILEEARGFVGDPRFKGYIHDVGGPTANFRKSSCKKAAKSGLCKNRACLAPVICKNVEVDHSEYMDILRALRKIEGIKKVFIRSGIRFDYLVADKDPTFFKELVRHHISGQLKVAPEHCSKNVLELMGKPEFSIYRRFAQKFKRINETENKKQFLVPYLISSHPGATLDNAVDLAMYLKEINHTPQQVQDFYPTPGTLSTAMFYTGLNPLTMEPVYVPRDPQEKAMQRALLQFKLPQNRGLVHMALQKTGRRELLGKVDAGRQKEKNPTDQPKGKNEQSKRTAPKGVDFSEKNVSRAKAGRQKNKATAQPSMNQGRKKTPRP